MKKHLLVIVLGMFSGIFGHEVPTGSESPGMAKFSQMLSKLVNPLVIKEQITDNEWMMTVKAKTPAGKEIRYIFSKETDDQGFTTYSATYKSTGIAWQQLSPRNAEQGFKYFFK